MSTHLFNSGSSQPRLRSSAPYPTLVMLAAPSSLSSLVPSVATNLHQSPSHSPGEVSQRERPSHFYSSSSPHLPQRRKKSISSAGPCFASPTSAAERERHTPRGESVKGSRRTFPGSGNPGKPDLPTALSPKCTTYQPKTNTLKPLPWLCPWLVF